MTSNTLHHVRGAAAAMLATFAAASMLAGASSPTFYDDDPVLVERDTQDASSVEPLEISLFVDLARGLLARPAAHRGVRAGNINTIDEVPDSNWFTNRAGARELTEQDVLRGPDQLDGPAPGVWTIAASKSDGVTPGFTVTDSTGERWFLKFDAPGYPRMATGTEVVVTKLLWALGFNVPENYIARLRPEQLTVGAGATIRLGNGRMRPLRRADIDALLERVHAEEDGSYRVVASRALPGTPVGRIRFSGTRPDDPNDLVPHEDRRELRGYGVFAAWLNHVDAKAINSLEVLVQEEGRTVVRRYLLDFGSALGSGGVAPADYWAGSEYLLEPRRVGREMIGFGFAHAAWRRASFYESPVIGRFPRQNSGFDPERWRPRVPNPAFVQARLDDRFWAARKLAALNSGLIRAAVRAGQFGDAAAEEFLVRALAERRDAISRAYLPAINPIVSPALSPDGELTFLNAAVEADVARAPRGYRAEWFRFDNAAGTAARLGDSSARTTQMQAPVALPQVDGAFVKVELSAIEPEIRAWERPVHVYFRFREGGWHLVGLDRMPE